MADISGGWIVGVIFAVIIIFAVLAAYVYINSVDKESDENVAALDSKYNNIASQQSSNITKEQYEKDKKAMEAKLLESEKAISAKLIENKTTIDELKANQTKLHDSDLYKEYIEDSYNYKRTKKELHDEYSRLNWKIMSIGNELDILIKEQPARVASTVVDAPKEHFTNKLYNQPLVVGNASYGYETYI